jgi:hypothetical protein
MKITIFGTGYVGLVQSAVLAEVGHAVLCVDVDAAKIAGIREGRIPIYEPGLEEIVQQNHTEGRLGFTTDAALALLQASPARALSCGRSSSRDQFSREKLSEPTSARQSRSSSSKLRARVGHALRWLPGHVYASVIGRLPGR